MDILIVIDIVMDFRMLSFYLLRIKELIVIEIMLIIVRMVYKFIRIFSVVSNIILNVMVMVIVIEIKVLVERFFCRL